MPIRFATNCSNCNNFRDDRTCAQHNIKVSERHTCDSFHMKAAMQNNVNCSTCIRFDTSSCSHPTKAAPEMLCSGWVPLATA